ncbi:galanin receptor 2b-like [Ptychodera flava]|uniref:galanin receptor 2b-like n=1 Tax=Ptychodera flava TaxID=63121 RepID=UPI00396A9BD8
MNTTDEDIVTVVGNATTEGVVNSGGTGSVSAEVFTMNIIFAVLGVVGIVGNTVVCLVLAKVGDFRTTNLFIFNQSLIDLTSSVLVILQNLGPNKYNVVVPVGLRGQILCKLWLSRYFMWAMFNVSTYNLISLSLERFAAIVFPIAHRQRFSLIKAKGVCVFVWALGLAYQSYWAEANYNKGNGYCGVHYPEGSMQAIIGIVVFLVEYLVPITVMAFSYTSMFLILKRRSRKLATTPPSQAPTGGGDTHPRANEPQENPSNMKARRNVLKMLVIVCMSYAICWGPNHIMYLEYNLVGKHHSRLLINTTVVMAFCNMCVNPIIYALKYRQFQDGLKKLFCRKKVGAITTSTAPAVSAGATKSHTSSTQQSREANASNSSEPSNRFLAP